MQKIVPSLWFDKNCEEALNLYTSIFNNSKIISIKRYPDHPVEGLPMQGMEGKIITAIFELEGQRFMALDGGSYFTFNPSVSFMVSCDTAEETDALFNKLAEGGKVLMELNKYPWTERYGWVQDKFGLSWQINTGKSDQKIAPALMFIGDKFGLCEEAVTNYVSIFKNSEVKAMFRYEAGEGDSEGKIKHAWFSLENFYFTAMESSHEHKFNPNGAVSFFVECETQEEVDYYWEKLSAGGDPKAQQCGWLQDKYGFSWQIVPKRLGELLESPDKEKADKAMKAMLGMKKIEISKLEEAVK